MNSFIVVGACNTLVPQVLLALRSAGKYRCTVLGGPNTRSLQRSSLCDEHIEIDFDEPDDNAVAQRLAAIAQREPNALLLPADCESIRMISRIKSRLRIKTIPIPDVATMNMFDDKWRFFQFCMQHQLSVPETIYVGTKDKLDFEQTADRLGVPFILKPINQAGSEGVQVIHSEAHYCEAILDNRSYQFGSLIAQRYIAGSDVCIDLFAVKGKIRALAFQQRVGSTIRFFANEQMEQIAHQLARAGNYNGIMNLDARIEDGTGKVYLLESNPRFWASLTASVGAGLNFVAESIKPVNHSASVRMLTQGQFHMRHPVARPASWIPLMFDTSGHGRLLRAKMSDMQMLGSAVKSLAVKPLRQLPQLFSRTGSESAYHIQRR